jgi:hypothetical protein
MDWINLPQDRDKGQAVVHTATITYVPNNLETFLTR